MRSRDKRLTGRRLRAGSHARAIGYGLAACAVLGFGTIAWGNPRVFAITVLAVIAIPVVGFTLNQVALTSKGHEVAHTVDDVRILKEADARAFAQPFAAITRKLPVYDVYSGEPFSTHPVRDWGLYGTQLDERLAPDNFWASLTATEQAALAVAAQEQTFDVGVVLWRQNQHGDHVIVIRSGKAHIFIEDDLGQRVIAARGPGDIIGERAALRSGTRSATVITATEVRAFIIATAEFGIFITEHPRVLTDVLEKQIYYRLTEDRPGQSTAGEGQSVPRPVLSSPPWTGQNCSICLTDITAYSNSSRRDEDRRLLRQAMYRMLEDAFNDSGVSWRSCYWEDRGDGALIIVPPSIPTSAVVDAVVVRLAAALRQHNRRVNAATRISLRVATHVGPVTADARGVSGHAIDQAARLVEAAPLKRQIARTAADLGLAASEYVFDTVISQDHVPEELTGYQKIKFQAKGSKLVAWMYLSGITSPDTGSHLTATMRRTA